MRRNLLLGCGENLVTDLPNPKRWGGEKKHPYKTPEEVYARLCPQMNMTVGWLSDLDARFCPEEQSVFRVALHPAYLAKSYFPERLLSRFNLRVIGSRFVPITPAKQIASTREQPNEQHTIELYVAGHRNDIRQLSDDFRSKEYFEDIRKIERIRAFEDGERLVGYNHDEDVRAFELVMHSDEDSTVLAFADLAKRHGIEVLSRKRMQTAGLCFLPMRAESWESIAEVERFSFLRLVRKMPRLRFITRDVAGASEPISLENLPPCTPDVPNAAVFDVGCDVSPQLNGWVRAYSLEQRLPVNDVRHGTLVNSAVLFGSADKNKMLVPVSHIDSYQVIDPTDMSNDFELYEALERICQILDTHDYKFVNLSIGPDLPIDDDEVHAWTAKLDERLSGGQTLLTIAVGNNGLRDHGAGNDRVEVPGDSVNALSVGASTVNCEDPNWSRAEYSAVGPGRMPGRIKPDVLDFGGCRERGFGLIDPIGSRLTYRMGTSFAAPNTLHKCIALNRRYPELGPLALKALMIHTANGKKGCSICECGHGNLPEDLDRYVVCDDDEMTIVYQGRLEPHKYVRAEIPVPEHLQGRITLRATLCYATGVNPETPGNYTRGAIDVKLRPDVDRLTKDEDRPETKSFFEHGPYESESTLREYGLKWDTAMKGEKNFDSEKSVSSPFFELHYLAREGMNYRTDASPIPYALLVTVKSPKTPNIYNEVKERYKTQIRPIVEIPITTPVHVAKVEI